MTNNRTGELDRPLDPASVYRNVVLKYGLETGISAEVNGVMRAFAARHSSDEYPDPRGRHRQGPGVARPR